ncbi:MAG: permease prefix domain 2-containing transporter, partial [Proteobacteria bacterium]|nr:permease prefix domain 2-containing transporter [Pseudomonadota bacterium]
MKEVPHPPKWINPLLERVCKPELLEEIEGDLLEYYHLWVEKYGTAKANRLYVIHRLKFLRPFALKKSRSKTTNHFAMF